MSEMSRQLKEKFTAIIDLRLSQVEGIVKRTPPGSVTYGQEMIEELALRVYGGDQQRRKEHYQRHKRFGRTAASAGGRGLLSHERRKNQRGLSSRHIYGGFE